MKLENPADTPLPPGGGGLTERRNAEIEGEAVRKRWNIPDKFKDGIVNRQVQIAINPNSTDRHATSAARVLVAMESQNQTDQHKTGGDAAAIPVSTAEVLAAMRGMTESKEGSSGPG